MQLGPSTRTTYHCQGCTFLHLEDWKWYGENDEVDRGTDATCNKVHMQIAAYYSSSNHTPIWCPFLEEKENESNA